VHVGADRLPLIDRAGASVRVITGHAFGATAPVPVFSSTLYCAITLQAGASLEVPDEHPECAVLVAEGAVEIDGSAAQAGELAVLTPGVARLVATGEARLMLLGGAPVGERFMWWNFVASSRERIEAGKVRWSRYGSAGGSGQFPPVPGDAEFIPLPPR
jgi:redox-sensitive bicupin YhaK (pirin superfamily)